VIAIIAIKINLLNTNSLSVEVYAMA
jgi:hypothetical protein